MSDFLIDMALSVLFSALRQPKVLGRYKKAFLKLRDVLLLAFPIEQVDIQTVPGFERPGRPPL